MICELCGKPIIGKPIKSWIEGAQLTVCHRCSRYGSTVKPATQRATLQQLPKRREVRTELENMVLVGNYNVLIRQARESMGLTQEDLARLIGEKESIIRRLESGRMTPTLELAKKLERLLKIKLYEEVRQEQEVPRPQNFELTLGDVAVIRERK
ncbi:MAG: multiprotein bridging factor aMBF1 [Candidatus Nezhaarchaeales archaeon]|nr:MAG: TIGR00270 family protein [Candidatus Nezhaarchaeota archaeon WYZ-LMO8]TDA36804.1 MAG: TIGR00270 family protein [Candidatus Nezhaarchaeota archaeon WYZ-LMO7]